MKKKFFNALSALVIAAVLALNVTVVLDDNATSYLKWDVIGKIFADGTSGSGSGSGNQATCYSTYKANPIYNPTVIIQCGTCDEKKCYEYSDPGTCTFN